MRDPMSRDRQLHVLGEWATEAVTDEIRESITNALAAGATATEVVRTLIGEHDDEVEVGAEAEIDPGTVRTVRAFGLRVAVGRTAADAGGRLFAIEATCPHANGPLDLGAVTGDRLSCPLHGFDFALPSGACVTDERFSVRALPFTVRSGSLVLLRPAFL